MSIKVVELFAGVGGFRVGLEEASKDFKTIWANQWEPGKKSQWAYECYESHFGKGSCVNEDIAKVKNKVPSHDLLVGGFPCQDYSVAATGAKGIEGKKGVLWWEIRDIVEKKKPKYILLENVDRLLKSPAKQRGRDFGIILKSLTDLNYIVEWRVVNAADYGCVQRRRRVFIFAYKQSTNFGKKINKKTLENVILKEGFYSDVFKGTPSKKKESLTFDLTGYKDLVEVTKKFKQTFYNSGVCIKGKGLTIELEPKLIKSKTLNDVVLKKEVDKKYFLSGDKEKKFKYLRGSKKIERQSKDGHKYLYAEGAMSPYDDLSMPSRTMLTSEGSVNRSTHIIKDKKTNKLRILTPIECERLNGFPDNWTNSGMPENFRYFCMGNALVVPLITMIGKKINKIK